MSERHSANKVDCVCFQNLEIFHFSIYKWFFINIFLDNEEGARWIFGERLPSCPGKTSAFQNVRKANIRRAPSWLSDKNTEESSFAIGTVRKAKNEHLQNEQTITHAPFVAWIIRWTNERIYSPLGRLDSFVCSFRKRAKWTNPETSTWKWKVCLLIFLNMIIWGRFDEQTNLRQRTSRERSEEVRLTFCSPNLPRNISGDW